MPHTSYTTATTPRIWPGSVRVLDTTSLTVDMPAASLQDLLPEYAIFYDDGSRVVTNTGFVERDRRDAAPALVPRRVRAPARPIRLLREEVAIIHDGVGSVVVPSRALVELVVPGIANMISTAVANGVRLAANDVPPPEPPARVVRAASRPLPSGRGILPTDMVRAKARRKLRQFGLVD